MSRLGRSFSLSRSPNLGRSSNTFLATLAEPDRGVLLSHAKTVSLPTGTILCEAGDTISMLYFLNRGMVSLLLPLASGDMIEAAMIGSDGVVGGSAALGDTVALCRMVVQIAGEAAAVDASIARELAAHNAVFRTRLFRNERFVLAQSQQSAACNATHPVEARLSRLLLRCLDTLHSDELPLTQEFLADMLGVSLTESKRRGQSRIESVTW